MQIDALWYTDLVRLRFIAILLVIFDLSAEQASEEFVQLCANVLDVKGIDAKQRTGLLKAYLDKLCTIHDLDKKIKITDPNGRSNGCKL